MKNTRIALICLLFILFLQCKTQEKPQKQEIYSGPEISVFLYGNTREEDRIHQKIIDYILKIKPAAIIHTGNMLEDALPSSWNKFSELFLPLKKSNIPFYPCRGNMDTQNPYNPYAGVNTLEYMNKYIDFFQLEKTYYTLIIGNTEFIFIDYYYLIKEASAGIAESKGSHSHWLKEKLAEKNVKFQCLISHYPLLSSGLFGSSKAGQETVGSPLRKTIGPLLRDSAIDLIISGHESNYERLDFLGIPLIITGGGNRNGLKIEEKETSALFYRGFHYCLIGINPTELKINVYDLDNEKIDELLLEK